MKLEFSKKKIHEKKNDKKDFDFFRKNVFSFEKKKSLNVCCFNSE